MQKARLTEDRCCAWVEVCFCSTPLTHDFRLGDLPILVRQMK